MPMILLVEDDPDHEALAIRALRKANVANDIHVARDGAEAIAFMQEIIDGKRNAPQLVLLDLKLPKVSGMEVLEQIRHEPRTRRLPVVILTSSNGESDVMPNFAASILRSCSRFSR